MKPQDPPAAEERSGQTQTRKTYEKPELQVYGDLAEITRGTSGSNTNDGQGHPNKHFTS
jgi:hypothetical protein